MLPPSCRYQPSCSAYAITALQRYGAAKGGWLALKRICRCHPWGGQGPTLFPEDLKDSTVNDNQQHDPRDRAERPGADRLDLGREQIFPDRQPAADPRSRTARSKPLPQPPAAARPPRRRRRFAIAPSSSAEPRASGSKRRRSQGSINLKGARIDDLVLVKQRETIAKNSPPVRLLSPLGAPGAYFAAVRLERRRASRRPTPTASGPPSAPVLTPGQAGDAELDQSRPASASSRSSRSTTTICSRSSSGSSTAARRAGRVRPIGLASRADKSPDPSTAGPSMSARSASSAARPTMTSTGRRSTKARPATRFDSRRRLARLHRQILADRARSRGNARDRAPLPQIAERRLPGRLCAGAQSSSRPARR